MDAGVAVALIGVGSVIGAGFMALVGERQKASQEHARWLRERRFEAASNLIAHARRVAQGDGDAWSTALQRADELSLLSGSEIRAVASTMLLASENRRQVGGSDEAQFRQPYDDAIQVFFAALRPLVQEKPRTRVPARRRLRTLRQIHPVGMDALAAKGSIDGMKRRLDEVEASLSEAATRIEAFAKDFETLSGFVEGVSSAEADAGSTNEGD